MSNQERGNKIEPYIFLPIGGGIGVAVGSAMRNIGVGIALGAALGTIASLIMYQLEKPKK